MPSYTRNTRNIWNLMAKPLRETMPITAEFIDEMRAAFGDAEINAAIRAGMSGARTFYARENGREIGTKNPERGLTLNQIVVGPYRPAPVPQGARK